MDNDNSEYTGAHDVLSPQRRHFLKTASLLTAAQVSGAKAFSEHVAPAAHGGETSPKVWLITGASRGFGRAIAETVLASGDRLLATARNPARFADLQQRFGDRLRTAALDVTDSAAARDAVYAAVDGFGRLDVVVNNAGFANIAPVETASEEDFRRQFETNFWGIYHVSRAALPVMKRQRSGTIVQFSSIGGRVGGTAGLGSYQAAKFAVDGFTRVLAAETAPFGIRYLTLEPGGFATDWAGSSMQIQEIPAEYDGTVGAIARIMGTAATNAGDPKRAAEIILRVVRREHLPAHLILGAGPVDSAQKYSRHQIAEAEAWRQVSASADFGRPYPPELPADKIVV
jgi:NAD(P)-dependent dehydrogenase (short-subunit alcohol dehydrogenase family)